MPTDSEIAAAREELARVRERMSDTAAELEDKLSAPVDAVKERLDVVQLIRDHPWPALAVALGAGVAIAASGADRKAASAAVDASRSAARAGAETVKSAASRAASATADTARHGPSRARGAIVGAVDSLAARLATTLIESFRHSEPQSVASEPSGLGYADRATPETDADSAPV